jgi:hypothetical protein
MLNFAYPSSKILFLVLVRGKNLGNFCCTTIWKGETRNSISELWQFMTFLSYLEWLPGAAKGRRCDPRFHRMMHETMSSGFYNKINDGRWMCILDEKIHAYFWWWDGCEWVTVIDPNLKRKSTNFHHHSLLVLASKAYSHTLVCWQVRECCVHARTGESVHKEEEKERCIETG